MYIICDDDAAETMQSGSVPQEISERRMRAGSQAVRKEMNDDMTDRAGQGLYTAASGGRHGFLCVKVTCGQVFLCGKTFSNRGKGNRMMVYITFIRTANHLCDLGCRGRAGESAPEKQNQYIKQTYFFTVVFREHDCRHFYIQIYLRNDRRFVRLFYVPIVSGYVIKINLFLL